MKPIVKILIAILVLSLEAAGPLRADVRNALRDSLENTLPRIHSSRDSLRVLLDILDLSISVPQRAEASRRAFFAAINARDTAAIIETSLYRANLSQKDTVMFGQINSVLDGLESTPRAREARLYIDFMLAENHIDADTEKRGRIAHLIRSVQANPDIDPYERARMLYSICYRLGKITRGDLYGEYIDKLNAHLDSMNLPLGSVRNLVYNRMAPVFTNNLEARKAVETDKKLLNIIDSLSTSYYMRGRKYRTLNRSRYICYRRLMCNYKALSPSEIEIYNRSIRKLARSNEDIASDLANNPRIDALYLMANKRYAEAIPLLKRAVSHKSNHSFKYVLYSALLEAAQAVGDKDESLTAALELNSLLSEMVDDKSEERYREIQIVSDVNELQNRKSLLDASRHKAQMHNTYVIITISGIALLLLAGLILMLLHQNRKTRKLASDLRHSADRLRKERNDLRIMRAELIAARDKAQSADKLKEEFIDNMSHELKVPLNAVIEYTRLIVDCIPEDKNKYLQRFANIVELNTKLMLTLVDDLLDVTTLEHNNMPVNLNSISVQRVAQVALGSIFDNGQSANPQVKVFFNPQNKPDITINTDGPRLVQVLVNLLSNAEKFTEKGSIVLDYDVSDDHVVFSVTDTGCGIPEGREEMIFGRFNKLDSSAAGSGLGLYISRLIARLLGGTLAVDRTYHRGARFLLTLPL